MFHCLELSPLYFLTIKCQELMTLEMGQLIHHDNKETFALISPGNLDSSWCFIQPRVSHDILCM